MSLIIIMRTLKQSLIAFVWLIAEILDAFLVDINLVKKADEKIQKIFSGTIKTDSKESLVK
jgi:hypothetical protein